MIVFSSGRSLDVNGDIIGISREMDVYGGYDNAITYPRPEWYDEDEGRGDMTDADALELADMMIARWQTFRAKVAGK